MARRPQETPTEAELEILKVLWERGPSTGREVLDILSRTAETGLHSVMSVLNIMANKGQVIRKPHGRAFIYSAKRPRKKHWARWSTAFWGVPSKGPLHPWCLSCSTNRNRHPENSTKFGKSSKNMKAGVTSNESVPDEFRDRVCGSSDDGPDSLYLAGCVLTLILLVTVKLLDVRTARLRYLLSVGTLLMMGIAPIVTAMLHHQGNSPPQHFLVEMSGRSNPIIEEHTAINAVNMTGRIVVDLQKGSAAPWNPSIEVYVLIAWLVGVSILSTRLAIGIGVTLWVRVNVKPLPDEFEQRIRILGDRLRVDARQRVFACVRVGQAVAVGFIRPVVLIPASWLTQLTPEMIEAIIAHELAHIRRWDLWVNLEQRIIETLLFYHPAVWWLSSRIRLEREMCCDEIAAECFDRVLYARSLESVARIGHGNLLMATSINGGKKMKLLNRIRYLLGLAPADAAGNWWAVGFVAMVLPFAAAVAFSLPAVATPAVATADNDSAKSTVTKKIVATSPQAKAVTVTEQYVCQIHSQRHIDVRSVNSGYLMAIPIKEGQAVKAGEVMFEIVPVLYKARWEAAAAERDLANWS